MSFEFYKLTEFDVRSMMKKLYVHNVSREELAKLQIVQNKFDTEDMGGSVECVDIFVDTVDNPSLISIGEYLALDSFFVKESNSGSGIYNVGGMLEVLDVKGIKYTGIIVIVRVASNFLLDSKSFSHTISYYNVCSDGAFKFLEENPLIDGWIAKNEVYLRENYIYQLTCLIEDSHKAGNLSDYNYELYRSIVLRGE